MTHEELFKKYGIAITGNIATGKSFVGQILKKMNYSVIDADELAKEASKKGTEAYNKIMKHFGPDILDSSAEINRKTLSQTVFANEEQRLELEKILHPAIEELTLEQLKKSDLFEKPKLWFYEAALVVEKKKTNLFREVWLTHCTNATQMERLKQRENNYTDAEIKNILMSQKSFAQKRRHCHFEVNTDFSQEIIEASIKDKLSSFQSPGGCPNYAC